MKNTRKDVKYDFTQFTPYVVAQVLRKQPTMTKVCLHKRLGYDLPAS